MKSVIKRRERERRGLRNRLHKIDLTIHDTSLNISRKAKKDKMNLSLEPTGEDNAKVAKLLFLQIVTFAIFATEVFLLQAVYLMIISR